MKTEIFDYPLPENLIAYYPLEKRDYSRLLIVDRQTQSFVDKCFSDIIDEINPEDVLILNHDLSPPIRIDRQVADPRPRLACSATSSTTQATQPSRLVQR